MRKTFFFLGLLCTAGVNAAGGQIDNPMLRSARALIGRIAPGRTVAFIVETTPAADGRDVFELEERGAKVVLRGNSAGSIAVAFNYYLKYYCLTTVSWYVDEPVQLPAVLPKVLARVRILSLCAHRFFLNYCTFGYTMPWWTWRDWQRAIDWMALNGINMPLAITGEEAIWYKVWKKFGLSDRQIRGYFTGPAHLPWHRMSNLDHWQGPLPLSYISGQMALQKQILRRERELSMTPVLPAFSGHVPAALKDRYSQAHIARLSSWGGFPDSFRCYFLDPLDSLFPAVQTAFMQEQELQYGTSHVYGADPFNEVDPPNWDSSYLARVANTVYSSLRHQDTAAVWLMMTWVFYFERDNWTNDRIRAFIDAVPRGKIWLLDYYGDNTEVWRLTQAYFGHPFIWCYLGNFGGNTMLAGNLAETAHRLSTAMNQAGALMEGVGSTLEGFDVNPIMYDAVFERAWSMPSIDPAWVDQWADRRCGAIDSNCRRAWSLLASEVYTSSATLGQATLTNALPTISDSTRWTTNAAIGYDNRMLFEAWETMLRTQKTDRASFRYDIANIGRQVLGNYFSTLKHQYINCYHLRDLPGMTTLSCRMLALIDDMDSLVGTQSSFQLARWLNQARQMGKTARERDYFEENARDILTTWGGKGSALSDYANRSWSGLLGGFYRHRWAMFFAALSRAVKAGMPFDEQSFNRRVSEFEWGWVTQRSRVSLPPKMDAIALARRLAGKYKACIAADGE